MEIRKAIYRSEDKNVVDCEINHHKLGWIPYTFKFDEEDESFDSEVREYLKTADILPFKEKTEAQIVAVKIQEANSYLASTDWVEPYLLRHELGIEVLDADSNKLIIKAKRDEARAFLKEQGL